MSRPVSTKILDRLLEENRIDYLQYDNAVNQAARLGTTAEEALIDEGVLSETDMLKYLATLYKTQFVTTDKLAKLSVPRTTLKLIPRRSAEKLGVFPILFDTTKSVLSVVAADLSNYDLAKEIKLLADVREVKVYVARPGAVQACIGKFYGGEIQAFANLSQRRDGLVSSYVGQMQDFAGEVFSDEMFGQSSIAPRPEPAPRTRREGPQTSQQMPRIALPSLSPGAPSLVAPRVPNFGPSAVLKSADEGRVLAEFPTDITQVVAGSAMVVTLEDYVETLSVMVTLLEQQRQGLRGHAALVARLCTRLAERLEVKAADLWPIRIAALLHDFGKNSDSEPHLTPLYIAESQQLAERARTTYIAPVQVFDSVNLPVGAKKILTHMYERYDGAGFPEGLSKEGIPMGARILSLVESYADLTSNPDNPYQRALQVQEALDLLLKYQGTLFDPQVVEKFMVVAQADRLRPSLVPASVRVLLVEPNVDEVAPLELKFIERGFLVDVARDANEALRIAASHDIGVIVSEVDVQPMDGFALLTALKQQPRSSDIPFIFLTRRSDAMTVSKGVECGAADFLVKPTSTEVVVAKAAKLMERLAARGSRGLSGSLAQIGLVDMVQVLSHGRKTGKLTVTGQGQRGEVHFSSGQVHDAVFGQWRAAEAFYALLKLMEGQFSFDPSFVPAGERVMSEGVESLLLEGLRRLDEASR